jgi:uncharacterized protein
MIIDLRTISHGARHFDFTLEPGWWKRDEGYDQILGLDSPLNVHISISRLGSKYLFDGNLVGRLMIRCDRCLEPYYHNVDSDFQFFLSVSPSYAGQEEIELLEEDMSVDFITDDEICLDDIVREQIYLSLPIKCLCIEECSGLCPTCGSNLNIKRCDCQEKKGHPGFTKLKDIKLKEK